VADLDAALDELRAAIDRHQLVSERELRAVARPPRRLGWATFLQAIPGLALRFRPVPPGYATLVNGTFTVKCPCGEAPRVEREHATECACGRVFLASDKVYVAGGPAPAS
jgi:hypothetical protein